MAVRTKSLPTQVALAGGIDAWNAKNPEVAGLNKMIEAACQATTVDEAIAEVKALMSLGHNIWAYVYMRKLYNKNEALYYGVLLANPLTLMPVVYTPTVGEACQKFGKMPFYRRGCYVSIENRGNIKQVLEEYAAAELEKGPDGKPMCDCIVFTDGGRILGLGDLGTWGMGIPMGKLDLYTVCAGVNPRKTIPVVIDAGCGDASANTAKLEIRDDPCYTGVKKDRVVQKSAAGTIVNKGYFDDKSMIAEFMQSATEVFGSSVLLQFEDFNSNDAFPLLAEYRNKFLCYNDDIQGTASVCIAGLLGAIKLKKPASTNLREELKSERFLFHGAGSANLGAMQLLVQECGVPKTQIFVTNSRGVIWKSEDGEEGSFRNEEQKEFGQVGKPSYNSLDLAETIKAIKPSAIIGAVGRAPGCFTKQVVESMVEVNKPARPVIFALSNPKTQAEITAEDAYTWSGGTAIYGSGTKMEDCLVNGSVRTPSQVNNVYIFPGTSMGAIQCEATSIPESFFLAAADAVANALDVEDMKADRVIPAMDKIRYVGLKVATAVVMEAQRLGLAKKKVGETHDEVEKAIRDAMWVPEGGSSYHEDALAVAAKVVAANDEGRRRSARQSARQLPVDSEVSAHVAAPNKLRAIKLSVDSKRPRFVEQGTIPCTTSLEKDFAKVTAVLTGDEPLGCMVRLSDTDKTLAGVKDNDWVIILYIPEKTVQRQKLQWQGCGDSFATNYPELRIEEWRISDPKDVSYFAFMDVAKKVLTQ